ncbi:hypothetical protein DENSPDRAFT_615047 [Dentipellis sp. KUC8613]|nr:hypothetical protein DENSPDRAFT_615047 [Dentipellis sp. KUC8613]
MPNPESIEPQNSKHHQPSAHCSHSNCISPTTITPSPHTSLHRLKRARRTIHLSPTMLELPAPAARKPPSPTHHGPQPLRSRTSHRHLALRPNTRRAPTDDAPSPAQRPGSLIARAHQTRYPVSTSSTTTHAFRFFSGTHVHARTSTTALPLRFRPAAHSGVRTIGLWTWILCGAASTIAALHVVLDLVRRALCALTAKAPRLPDSRRRPCGCPASSYRHSLSWFHTAAPTGELRELISASAYGLTDTTRVRVGRLARDPLAEEQKRGATLSAYSCMDTGIPPIAGS